jgi:hypothetical protein
MSLLDELTDYFVDADIELLRDNLSFFDVNVNPSFWQITQENNSIKFELGYILNGVLYDITLQNHSINKAVVKLSNFKIYSITEKKGSLQLDLIMDDPKLKFYYKTSSFNRIVQLKKFSETIESYIRG